MKNFQCTVQINGTVEQVFKALTTQHDLQSWWTNDCVVDPRIGGKATFRFGNTYTVMQFEKLNPNTEVCWKCLERHHEAQVALNNKDEWVGTQIIFRITKVGPKQTELHFTHAGLNPTLECYKLCENGWNHYLKTSLKGYIENGQGAIYQKGGSSHDIVNQYYAEMKKSLKVGKVHFNKLFFADDAILIAFQEKYVGKEALEPVYNQFVSVIEDFEIKRQLIDPHYACTLIEYKTKVSPLIVEMGEWIKIKNGQIVEFRVHFDSSIWSKATQRA